jgi:DNA (cytosine-5)-methyltransferase 1
VYSKDFGVPQNRPRILLVGAHCDLGLDLGDDRADDPIDNPRGLIPSGAARAPDLRDVLGDLVDQAYLGKDATTRYLHSAKSDFQRAMRVDRHGRRLRKGARLTEQEYTRHSDRIRRKFAHMIRTGEIPPRMITRKFAQRVLPKRWSEHGPTITVTSLPDDFVHYSQPRILTVREWARLQMFPDWFEFRGPRTTGGHRRAGSPSDGVWDREVPKYTQIGNAVPVGLAEAVGLHLKSLLSKEGVVPSRPVDQVRDEGRGLHPVRL